MKANEFVKKFGSKSAKYWIDHFNNVNTLPDEFINTEFLGDLKRLIESHELVEIYTRRFNGDAEWFFVSEYCKKNRISPFFSENYNKASGIYKQAIADVESCQ